MPAYPFVCDECGETQDITLRMDDRDSPQECPQGHVMRRAMVAPMTVLWGGRWHSPWAHDTNYDGLGPTGE